LLRRIDLGDAIVDGRLSTYNGKITLRQGSLVGLC
jgi:hypothetical protein